MTDFGVLTAYIANIIGYGGAAIVLIIVTKGRLGVPKDSPSPT